MQLNYNKIKQIFAFLLLLFVVCSCEDDGCIEADAFDSKVIKVKANPTDDGVFGTYNDIDGGQTAEWKQTGLKTSNEDFIILISGSWIPWKADRMTDNKMKEMPFCQMCAKKDPAGNCLCFKGEEPKPVIADNGLPVSSDPNYCDDPEKQNSPADCTCTKLMGKATDYGVFHFPLTYYRKNHERKLPDEQGDACRYGKGMGLYLGVFGKSSNEPPIRAYHLFSEEEICSIKRNSKGECIDENGISRVKYVFRSANVKPLVKDDNEGNDGPDLNLADNVYHKPYEYVKLIIYDRYYSDNYGYYYVEFLKGIIDDSDIGLLEYLANIVEDEMLGRVDANGQRQNGIMPFMYNSIVRDMYFGAILQISLALYICFFGLSYLFGLVEFTKKELYSRLIKVGLIMFFVSPSSWYFYNQIIVGFFKDSMDSVINIIVNLGSQNLDEESNPLVLAQLASNSPGSQASRFSYIDTMLRILFSENVTKKIWSLAFASIFGIVYIALIYCLIFFFLYSTLKAVLVYAVTIMKMIFALILGPIFIAFSLFKQTNESFKKWLGFVGARSLEIIMLFLLLYTFIMLIDHKFNALLYYPVCTEYIAKGFINIKILKAHVDRGFVSWMSMLTSLAMFIFMLNLLMDQIPSIAGNLITIGGVANKNTDASYMASGAKLAQGFMGDIFKYGGQLKDFAIKDVGRAAFRGLRIASQVSGVSAGIDAIGNKIPFRGPRALIRDSKIDSAIKKGMAEAKKSGLTGAAFDSAVRDYVFNKAEASGKTDQSSKAIKGLSHWRHNKPGRAAVLDMTTKNILARLDKKLVEDPMRQYLKAEAKKMRNDKPEDVLLGKDMERALKEKAKDWAKTNLTNPDAADKHIDGMKKFISKQGEFGIKTAAKKFGKSDLARDRFLEHLKNKQFVKDQKRIEKGKRPIYKESKKIEKFLGEVNYNKMSLFDRLIGRGSPLGTIYGSDHLRSLEAQKPMEELSRDFLYSKKTSEEKDTIREYYENKARNAGSEAEKRAILGYTNTKGELVKGKMQKKLDEADARRAFYRRNLSEHIRRKADDDIRAKDPREVQNIRNKAKEEVDRLAQLHQGKIKELTGNGKWKDEVKKNGGIEAYHDGTLNFGGTSLFEAQERLKFLDAAYSGAHVDAGGVVPFADRDEIKNAEKYCKDLTNHIDRTIKVLDEANTPQEKADALAAAQNLVEEDKRKSSILMQEADLACGKSIVDAITIQSSDIGLKAGNVAIGGVKNEVTIDKTMMAQFEFSKTQAAYKAKAKKFELKTKEYELQLLKADPANNKDRISTLEREISDIEYEVNASERELNNIDAQISDLKAQSYNNSISGAA